MNQLLEAALKYAAFGWQVFPCAPRQKVPITAHGVKDATSDADQIRAWWAKWPDANVAVACGKASGVYVIDVDVEEASDVDGRKSLEEFPELPWTVRQNTPRGGFHAFYRTNNAPSNRNSFRPGVDIRGNGYYVVAAPSIHPNGGIYTWAEGCKPGECAIVEFPEYMRPTTRAPWAIPQAHPTSPRTLPNGDVLQRASLYLAECEAAVQGRGGHDKLLWASSAMVNGFLLSDDQALDLLVREYNPRCVPPWNLGIPGENRDFRRKVTEARKLSSTAVRPPGWLLEDDSYTPIEVAPEVREGAAKLVTTFKGVPLVYEPPLYTEGEPDNEVYIRGFVTELEFLTHPKGLLGEICKWINSTAIRQQPLLTLACALAFCGVLFGRKVRDSLGSRTNLYCMGVAPSSAGKAHAPSQIRRLCGAAGCMDLLGGDDVASDSAIEDRMERQPASLFLWDEIGFLLSHIRSGISQYHVRIVPLLMKLYSASGSVFKGREYAESEKQRTIIQPCCCIYGTSTPERFSSGISPEELQDGWLSRCLVFRTHTNPPKVRGNCEEPVPQAICDQVTKWFTRQVGETDGHDISAYAVYRDSTGVADVQPPEQIIVPRTTEAESIFVNFDNESTDSGKANPALACLWTKVEENARRIALILAASENFESPVITESIADYACRLVRYLLVSFARDTVPRIVTCQVDAQKQKLFEIISKAGVGGCSNRQLTHQARWSTKKQRSALLEDLIEAMEIVAQKKDSKKIPFFWTTENYQTYLAKK